VAPGGEETVRVLLGDVAALSRSVGFRVPEAELTFVVGIGAGLSDRLFPGPRPAELHEFREIVGNEHTAVSTRGDLLFHLRSRRADVSFELAMHLRARLRGSTTVVDEMHGFRCFEQRGLAQWTMSGVVDRRVSWTQPGGAASRSARTPTSPKGQAT
jgi:putative iron-dependent peroxidase